MLSAGWGAGNIHHPRPWVPLNFACPTAAAKQLGDFPLTFPGIIVWLGEHEQDTRQTKTGSTSLPQEHPSTSWRTEFWGQERFLQPHKSQSSPQAIPSVLGGTQGVPKLALSAWVRSREEEGRQPKGAFAQLDHRLESQDSLFPAQVTAQHFHGEPGMGDEARAAPGAEGKSAAAGTRDLPHVASWPGRVRSYSLAFLQLS